MRLYISLLLAAYLPAIGYSQQTLTIKLLSAAEKLPVAGSILVQKTRRGYATDSTGHALIFFASVGRYHIFITATGYQPHEEDILIPFKSDTLAILLERKDDSMEEVIIQSTRTSRSIAATATRVEMIGGEELDEKNNMRPASVAMLLHESTGIQVQQTSATSGSSSIRIQGLDGRYSQLLKDGFPNFGNFSSGLSVLEIPPLDLKQVEVIKGPASPLFGGGAIAGVINFISKKPGEQPEYNLLLNQSSLGQTNIGAFASGRNKQAGYTLFATYNTTQAYDVDKDGFTEVPRSKDFTIHPVLFFYPNEGTTISIGNSFTHGNRIGGDVNVIKGIVNASHPYFERNTTTRNISTVQLDKKLSGDQHLAVKQSFSVFDRAIEMNGYDFAGKEYNAYTDISYLHNKGKHALVTGLNFIYNQFNEQKNIGVNRDNESTTMGAYAQHTLDAGSRVKLESGLRIDRAAFSNSQYKKNEWFVLPRVSLLLKYNNAWSSRIGAGLGYKTPSLFTEQTETIQYRNVKQLNGVRSERSYGATADVNFRHSLTSNLSFTFNHMFFYTAINHPLVLQGDTTTGFYFYNASQPVTTMGFETNARFIFRRNLKLFAGYTFTNTHARYYSGNQHLPLVPMHKLNLALIYEKENVIKLGLEGYFTGRQYLSNGMETPSFPEFGFMAEKPFRIFSLFINFENFTDTRQSRYKPVVSGPRINPAFDEIWTHTEGFAVNGGIKFKW